MNNQVSTGMWDADRSHKRTVLVHRTISDVESMVIDMLKRAFIDLQPKINVTVDVLNSNSSVSKSTEPNNRTYAVQFWTGKIEIECASMSCKNTIPKHYEASFNISISHEFVDGILPKKEILMTVELAPRTTSQWEKDPDKVIKTASLVKQALVTYIKTVRPFIGYNQCVETVKIRTEPRVKRSHMSDAIVNHELRLITYGLEFKLAPINVAMHMN